MVKVQLIRNWNFLNQNSLLNVTIKRDVLKVMQEEIINRVSSSNLISFNLEEYYPKGERVVIDIKDQLFQGMILREKDFRDWLKNQNWAIYQDKYVAIGCSEDAIIPTWAFMLLATKLQPYAKLVVYGSLEALEQAIWSQTFSQIDFSIYQDAKIVIKGCSIFDIPVYTYTELTRILQPLAASLMFGEPCSTVPLYKKR